MSRLPFLLLLLGLAGAPLAAQEPDTPHHGPGPRHRVERRFAERLRTELELTDEQAARLKEVAKEHGSRRHELRRRERALTGALEQQLGAGEQANQDSVARLTRELLDLRVEYAESWRREMGRLSFLTPVQRARLMVMRDHLLERVHEMRRERRGYRHHGDGN